MEVCGKNLEICAQLLFFIKHILCEHFEDTLCLLINQHTIICFIFHLLCLKPGSLANINIQLSRGKLGSFQGSKEFSLGFARGSMRWIIQEIVTTKWFFYVSSCFALQSLGYGQAQSCYFLEINVDTCVLKDMLLEVENTHESFLQWVNDSQDEHSWESEQVIVSERKKQSEWTPVDLTCFESMLLIYCHLSLQNLSLVSPYHRSQQVLLTTQSGGMEYSRVCEEEQSRVENLTVVLHCCFFLFFSFFQTSSQ